VPNNFVKMNIIRIIQRVPSQMCVMGGLTRRHQHWHLAMFILSHLFHQSCLPLVDGKILVLLRQCSRASHHLSDCLAGLCGSDKNSCSAVCMELSAAGV
jgi:hypothetical protein